MPGAAMAQQEQVLLYCSFFPGVRQVRIDDSKASGGPPSLA